MTPEQREFILALDRDGTLLPADVLEAATPVDSPIHDLFTWDDSVAGHRFRMGEARVVIKRVRVNYIKGVPKITPIRLSEYIHDPDLAHGQQGYIRTGLLRTRKESASEALKAELERVASLVERTRMIADALGLRGTCEKGLRAILLAKPKSGETAANE